MTSGIFRGPTIRAIILKFVRIPFGYMDLFIVLFAEESIVQ